jgi:hypothetical protein
VYVAAGLAAAQGWKEYPYRDYAFSVAFPVDPKIETTTYPAPNGRSIEARVYSVMQDNAVFTMTIAEFVDAGVAENAVIEHAIRSLSRGGEIKLDIPHRIRGVYGRQLSIAWADGSYSFVALFFYRQRLYQLEGKALAGGTDGRPEAMRFQQSLDFTESSRGNGGKKKRG